MMGQTKFWARPLLFGLLLLGCSRGEAPVAASGTPSPAPAQEAVTAAADSATGSATAPVADVDCETVVRQMSSLIGAAVNQPGNEEAYKQWSDITLKNWDTLVRSCQNDIEPQQRVCVMSATNIVEMENCTQCENCGKRNEQ